jgi:hypothetical protein
MAPRFWTVTIGDREFTVVAGTREAAHKIAARRAQQRDKQSNRRPQR